MKNRYITTIIAAPVAQSLVLSIIICLFYNEGILESRSFINKVFALNELGNVTFSQNNVELFFKAFVFCMIQYLFLIILFYISANLVTKESMCLTQISSYVAKSCFLSSLFLYVGIPFLYFYPISFIPFAIISFIYEILKVYDEMFVNRDVKALSGIEISCITWLSYFMFFAYCITETIRG